jgi:hypothetical protein
MPASDQGRHQGVWAAHRSRSCACGDASQLPHQARRDFALDPVCCSWQRRASKIAATVSAPSSRALARMGSRLITDTRSPSSTSTPPSTAAAVSSSRYAVLAVEGGCPTDRFQTGDTHRSTTKTGAEETAIIPVWTEREPRSRTDRFSAAIAILGQRSSATAHRHLSETNLGIGRMIRNFSEAMPG